MTRFSSRLWLALIVVSAVMARLVFIAAFHNTLSTQTSGYHTYAVNLLDDHIYGRIEGDADSDLPPLYPFFLAGVYAVFGQSPIAVALFQAVLEAAVIVLVYWIGQRVAGRFVGLIAAALYAFYPYLLFQNLTLNDTGLFIVLLAAGIACAYRALDTRRWWWAMALGLLFGFGALTKTLIILILPLLALWWWFHSGFRVAFRLSLIAGIALVAVIAPWMIRNIHLHDQFVLVSTNDGSNLHQGNNACVDDYLAHGWDAQWVDCIGSPPPDLNEVETANWHRDEAIQYLRNHPADGPRLFGVKFAVLWSPAIMPNDVPPDAEREDDAVLQYNTTSFQLARIVHLIYFTPLLILGLFGIILAWKNKLLIGPLIAVLVAITVAYLVFHPSTRYRSPADPFLFILSAYMLARLYNRFFERKSNS